LSITAIASISIIASGSARRLIWTVVEVGVAGPKYRIRMSGCLANGLIAGHARVLAARQLGIAEIPVMVAAGWSEAQKRAYVLADNQLAITGSGWDPELLRLELGELKLGRFDLSLTGFGDLELKDIMAERTTGLTDPDDAPAVPEHPVSQTGDLWTLGAKVTCPKCGKATALERAIKR
jgi:hypothetical protein